MQPINGREEMKQVGIGPAIGDGLMLRLQGLLASHHSLKNLALLLAQEHRVEECHRQL